MIIEGGVAHHYIGAWRRFGGFKDGNTSCTAFISKGKCRTDLDGPTRRQGGRARAPGAPAPGCRRPAPPFRVWAGLGLLSSPVLVFWPMLVPRFVPCSFVLFALCEKRTFI